MSISPVAGTTPSAALSWTTLHSVKLFKRCGQRIALIDGDWVSCRMYRGFREVVEGFSKNAFAILFSSLPLSGLS
jgi:hypothetical protein